MHKLCGAFYKPSIRVTLSKDTVQFIISVRLFFRTKEIVCGYNEMG